MYRADSRDEELQDAWESYQGPGYAEAKATTWEPVNYTRPSHDWGAYAGQPHGTSSNITRSTEFQEHTSGYGVQVDSVQGFLERSGTFEEPRYSWNACQEPGNAFDTYQEDQADCWKPRQTHGQNYSQEPWNQHNAQTQETQNSWNENQQSNWNQRGENGEEEPTADGRSAYRGPDNSPEDEEDRVRYCQEG